MDLLWDGSFVLTNVREYDIIFITGRGKKWRSFAGGACRRMNGRKGTSMAVEIRDELDVWLMLAAKNCGNAEAAAFEARDTSRVTFGDAFRRKMKRIIKRGGETSPVPIIKKAALRVAAVLVAIMAIGFITVMAVPDLREAVLDAVISWYDDYITIDFLPLQNSAEDTTPANVEAAMLPEYIPADAERNIVVANGSVTAVDYFRNGELFCCYVQTRLIGGKSVYDSQELTGITNVMVDGRSSVLLDYGDGEYMLVWHDGVYRYDIYCRWMDVDEIIAMAESIAPLNGDKRSR